MLRKLAATIGHPLDGIRKIVEAARRPHASREMQRVQAASDDRSIEALVRTAHQALLHGREVVVQDAHRDRCSRCSTPRPRRSSS